MSKMNQPRFHEHRFALFVAWRYLFGKKSQNVINLITAVSMGGVLVGTFALVCVLSIMNGFEGLSKNAFSQFDPELKIVAANGAVFSTDSPRFAEIKNDKAVAYCSETLEDNALVSYMDNQMPITLKGVDANYEHLITLDSIMVAGNFRLHHLQFDVAVAGLGVAGNLNLTTDYVNPVKLYVPYRTGRVNLARPDAAFKQGTLFVSGIFSVMQAEYDDNFIIVPIEFARQMYDYDSCQVTSLELKLTSEKQLKSAQRRYSELLGSDFRVLDRHEQQASFYRIVMIEKWITFLILALILFIAVCNIIGSLSMLLIDKSDDIRLYRNIGAEGRTVQRIFLYEGWLIAIVGAVVGLLLGVAACLIQQHFGIIKVGTEPFVEDYPMMVKFSDLIIVLITVLTLGFVTAYYPVRFLNRKKRKANG